MNDVWLGIAFSLMLSSFFSGMEIAIVSSSRLEIELEAKKKVFLSAYISELLKKSWRVIGAMLVGNNIALVMYGIYMTKLLDPMLVPYIQSELLIVLIETLVSTVVVLFLAEFLPKAIFSLNPNRALGFFKIPFVLSYFILYIPTLFVIGLSERLLRIFMKAKIEDDSFNFGIIDLNAYLARLSLTESAIDNVDNEFLFLRNALEFSSTKARECMIPRNEIEAVDVEESADKLLQVFIESGLSKILVYRDDIDNIIGYIHSSAMFEKPDNIKSLLKPVMIVPESMTANNILKEFISMRKNVAIVVDEFGGTSGMITREDLLEEIFGEIDDEYDMEDLVEKKISKNTYEFSARLEIDYINENYDLNIPVSDDYETLAGYILKFKESIPAEGEELRIDQFRIKVLKVSEHRIDQVSLKVPEEE